MLTHPDIAFIVNKLYQVTSCSTKTYWTTVKRLLHYLAWRLDRGLFLQKESPFLLHAYSDSDWAADHDDHSSTIADVVFLGCNPISWSSKKQ